jgi:LPXTG-site transpeptidase (sortase) family protein
MPSDPKLRRINDGLLALIILLNLYIIVAPFSPALVFWYQKKYETKRQQQLVQKIQALTPSSRAVTSSSGSQPNQVIIPSILLDQTINEGSQMYVELDKGVWRWPDGSTPAKGGNTILIGHRFTYTNPRGVFYELNEVKLGDQIGVIWNNVSYDYKVSSINQVAPTQTSILDQTSQPEITLYTCTPLFAPKYRLVVVAQLEGS